MGAVAMLRAWQVPFPFGGQVGLGAWLISVKLDFPLDRWELLHTIYYQVVHAEIIQSNTGY